MDIKYYDSIKEGLGIDQLKGGIEKAISSIGNLDELISENRTNLVDVINGIMLNGKDISLIDVKINVFTLTSDSMSVKINGGEIINFNKDIDNLIVIKNSVVLIPTMHYIISSDGLNISSVDEIFKTGSTFYIVCLKSINKDYISSTGARELESYKIITNSINEVDIDINEYNPLIDKLSLFKDGLRLKEDVDYIIDKTNKKIKPIVGSFSNCKLNIVVLKQSAKVLEHYDMSLMDNKSIDVSKLADNAIYVHPNNASTRHVTDSEKAIWNSKQPSGNYILDTDSRLSDTRTPKPHNHNDIYYTKAEINNFNTTYTHNQSVPVKEWIVTHNLNKFPSVSVTDSANSSVEGDVIYLDNNSLKIIFSSEFSGKAYLN